MEAPNSEFFFGTDSMGRDIFSLIGMEAEHLSSSVCSVQQYYGNWYCIRMYQWCVRLLSGFCNDADNRSSRKYTIYFIDSINYQLF